MEDILINQADNAGYDDIYFSIDDTRIAKIRSDFDRDNVTIKGTSLETRVKENKGGILKGTRTFTELPEHGERGTFFAEARRTMVEWKNMGSLVSKYVEDVIKGFTNDMKINNKKDFHTFSELVYFLDLQETAKIQMERGQEVLLPNGITLEEVEAVIEDIRVEDSNSVIEEALENRRKAWNKLRSDYITANNYIGFKKGEAFKRSEYFRHDIVSKMNKGAGTGKGSFGINVGRGWLKERRGSDMA